MNTTLKEAKRLYREGFAIHWLRAKSKAPVESGWTTGPRKKWSELLASYRPGYNVGVRLGKPSPIGGDYLAVLDIDVKSEAPHHREEALAAVKKIFGFSCPIVKSGRGNGSHHRYCVTKQPAQTRKAAESSERVKVLMPSAGKPSKKDWAELTEAEVKKGYRMRPAWEISILGNGAQVVLPPSIHPDTGKPYRWAKSFDKNALFELQCKNVESRGESERAPDNKREKLEGFKVRPVDLGWLDIPDSLRNAIIKGDGVTDRSAYLIKASEGLFKAGLDQNEVLSVLTDRETYLGECAYDHAKTDDRKKAAQWVHRYTVRAVTQERKDAQDLLKTPAAMGRKLSAEELEAQNAEFEEEGSWRDELICGKNDKILNLLQNTVTILENAIPAAAIKRDTFAFRDAYSVNTPWGGVAGDHVSDDDVARIKYWCGTDFKFEPSSTCISDALTVVALRNSFDPIVDFLTNLPEWDGVKRLDTWLEKNFEAQGCPEYLGQVFRKWMVAMVMRAYIPGAKFDWMPIFEGPQNVGKSSFGRILVGDKYFLDWLPNLADKDAALGLQGMWAVEFGELTQFRKNELEIIKAFITRTVDKVRPPYGRRMIEHARRCVFFGTTNKETYLLDETGNRRFKPIVVGGLNFNALHNERLQLFAEARHLWNSGAENERSLDLFGAAKMFELKIHQQKMMGDESSAMLEAMEDFSAKVEQKNIVFDLSKFRMLDLFGGIGPLASWRRENRNLQFAAKMLKKMGYEKKKVHGLIYWVLPEKIENEDFFG